MSHNTKGFRPDVYGLRDSINPVSAKSSHLVVFGLPEGGSYNSEKESSQDILGSSRSNKDSCSQ
jgi:hypothetical protein